MLVFGIRLLVVHNMCFRSVWHVRHVSVFGDEYCRGGGGHIRLLAVNRICSRLRFQDVSDHHINQHNSRLSSGNSNDFHQYDSQNQTTFHQNVWGTNPHKGQHNTLSRALIYIPSSSSSSSSASLFSESSLNSEWCLLLNKPQHSVSCSNLPEARIFQDEASGNMDFKLSDSALSIHHHKMKQEHFGHFGSQQQVSELGLKKSPLDRCQSKSVEGLPQSTTKECTTRAHGRPHSLECNQLYKTTSLGQTSAVKDKAAATVNMAKPKRAVSSIQLPSKGILKNKDKRQKDRKFWKVKSMEALSTKGQSTGPHKQSYVEALRKNFEREKIEFSAFLDEITRQVISPSKLSSFRINPSVVSTSHKLPHENQKQPAKAFNQEPVDVQKLSKQQNVQPVKSKNEKGRTDSSKQKCQPGSSSGVPQLHQQQGRQEKQHSTSLSYRTTLNKKHHEKYIQFQNKGTSTSPESILQEKHYQTKGKRDSKDGYGICRELNTKHKVSSLPAGLDMDMEFTKKSFTMTAPNQENINKHEYISYRRHAKQSHRDSVSSLDRAECLEQDNKDLHENLLQTVSCIENVKAELQCIKTELSSVKEKCKKLEENYTSCQQANTVLEHQLQSVIPYFIKQLLDKHFDSEDDVKNLLFSSSSCQLDTDKSDRTLGLRDTESTARKKDRETAQGDLAGRHEHVAEFLSWAENQAPCMD